jgi:hypothetical protein
MPCRPICSLQQLIQVREVQRIDEGIEILPIPFRYTMFPFEVASDAIVICFQGETAEYANDGLI